MPPYYKDRITIFLAVITCLLGLIGYMMRTSYEEHTTALSKNTMAVTENTRIIESFKVEITHLKKADEICLSENREQQKQINSNTSRLDRANL